MASELRVNTLKDASGNNSIATSFVAGGSAKVHVLSNAGAAASASLNVSGMTDNGTGDYTTSFSNAFGSANYASCAVPSRGLGDSSLSANVHTVPLALTVVNVAEMTAQKPMLLIIPAVILETSHEQSSRTCRTD